MSHNTFIGDSSALIEVEDVSEDEIICIFDSGSSKNRQAKDYQQDYTDYTKSSKNIHSNSSPSKVEYFDFDDSNDEIDEFGTIDKFFEKEVNLKTIKDEDSETVKPHETSQIINSDSSPSKVDDSGFNNSNDEIEKFGSVGNNPLKEVNFKKTSKHTDQVNKSNFEIESSNSKNNIQNQPLGKSLGNNLLEMMKSSNNIMHNQKVIIPSGNFRKYLLILCWVTFVSRTG